jgi:hypothetical protein
MAASAIIGQRYGWRLESWRKYAACQCNEMAMANGSEMAKENNTIWRISENEKKADAGYQQLENSCVSKISIEI